MKEPMKRLISWLLTAAMALSMVVLPIQYVDAAGTDGTSGSVMAEFYVAVNGSDQNDGKTAATPFATIAAARDAVREINQDMTGDIVVHIADGDYYLSETLEFGAQDSGTNGYEIIYRADSIGGANLIGGQKIEGWVLADETDVTEYDLDASLVGKVYKHTLTEEEFSNLYFDESRELYNQQFNTLYVNDVRATMARTRNRDNNPDFPMAKGEYLRSTGASNFDRYMNYNANDFTDEIGEKAIAGMQHAQERGEEEIAQVFVWDGADWDWFTETIPITSIDAGSSKLQFPDAPEDYPEKYLVKYPIGSGARYFLQGNLAFMDVPGEYHYNKTTHVIYYYPLPGEENMNEQTVVVPTMQTALYLKGEDKANLADEPDPDKQVHNITFDGIAVKDTEFVDYFTYSWNYGDGYGSGWYIGYYPEEAEGSSNPSYCETCDRPEFRFGSVTMNGTNHITLNNVRVKNSGLYGIIMDGDNTYNTIQNSVVENTGYGGIIFNGGYPGIGKYNNHHTVENVLLHGIGDLVGHAVGLTLMSTGQNTFTNMEIYDTPKRAILVIGGFRRARYSGDANYDELFDMYTIGNHFKYIHVHDAQQDAGEDSAVFLSWLLSGQDLQRLHGTNDPNDYANMTNLPADYDTTIDHYNYFEQMLITDVGADPSVIEKCTVGGLDTAMGASGSQFKNIKGANVPEHLLAIREGKNGTPGSYGDMYYIENCTNNVIHNEPMDWDCLKTFDDSLMEYDKIGLTDSFPAEYSVAKRVYREAPEDLWFGDDFETGTLDSTMWMVEKGEVDMYMGRGFMSENPTVGKCSLPITPELNANSKSGLVVSHPFDQDLNKIVEVQYFDRRKDYAGSDSNVLYPNTFFRADDGVNALGLGAVGTKSRDYYYIMKGDELILTNVKRSFGWHTFQFDYSSGTDVKLSIDGQQVAVYTAADNVATSFSYIAMGDWEDTGGFAFYDQLYIYGGQEAEKPVNELPQVHALPGSVALEGWLDASGVTAAGEEGAKYVTDIQAGDWVEYYVNVFKSGVYDLTLEHQGEAGYGLYVDGVEAEYTTGDAADSARVILKSGLHKIKIAATTGGWNLTALRAEYLGPAIPGKIEAEDADALTGSCRVDTASESGTCIGWIAAGDTATYKVLVEETAVYQLDYRLAAILDNCQIDFLVDGRKLVSTKFNSTGGWQSWRTFTEKVPLEAGEHEITLNFLTSGFNVNWMEFTKTDEEYVDDPVPPVLPAELLAEDFEGEETITLTAQKNNGTVVEVIPEPENEENMVLHVNTQDNTILYPDGIDWSNYTFTCRIKPNEGPGAQPWENVAPVWYAGSQDANGNWNRYSLKYRFQSKDFTLYCRGGSPLDNDFQTASAPSDYMGQWHTYQITQDNGHITAYIDGELIFDATHTTLTNGTIGFDGINTDFYVDDIKVTRLQTAAPTAVVVGEKDESGKYTGSVTVELNAAGDATIVYTVDGSDPTEYGLVYHAENPILITGNTTLKFAAVESGKTYSDIVTETIRFALPPVEGEIYLEEDFEGETTTEFKTQKGNAALQVIADPDDENNTILYVNAPDDFFYYPGGMDWENYTFECRMKLIEGPGAQPWENAAPVWYAGSQDAKGNWNRYSLKYRFQSGDFTLYRRDSNSSPQDNDFAITDAPDDYMNKWHDYRITIQDGHITAYIDGELIFDKNDTALPKGTIGFDGINTVFYVDDIKVTGPKTETPAADKSDLEALVADAKALNEEDYTEETWSDFAAVLAAAETVLANEDAIQADVDNAYNALDAAMQALEPKPVIPPVDKSALEALVADAKALNGDDYTEETWNAVAAALTAAEAVLANEDATQADVDNAYNALDAAMKALEPKPVIPPVDKSALETLVAAAKALNEEDYTEETWSGLEAALAAAEAVLADEEATQADVDAAEEALRAAMAGLMEKPEPEPEPEVDKSTLEALYNANKDRQQGNCTNTSWAVFQAALENAEAVLNDPDATQEDVDAAEAVLREAVEGLQEKPTFPVLPIIPGGSNTTKPANEMPFNDVNTGDWFYNDVKYVYENGIMNGVSDTRFAPQSTLTRAMVVTILYRMEGEPSTRYNALFPDVTDNQWYTKGVEWAANNGIVLGYTSGKFGPNDPVTREQLAAILYRYAQSKNYVLAEGSDLSAYADASNVSPYAVTAVQWSVTERLLEGSNGKLLPRQNATRAEVAHAIAGFCQNVGK